MSHDPLCNYETEWNDGTIAHPKCDCSLIRKVENRTRNQIATVPGVSLSSHPRATSREAARGVLPGSGSKQASLYEHFQACGALGCTDSEIEQRFEWSHQSASAARNRLLNRGLVTATDRTRKTASGFDATVWIDSSLASKEPDVQCDPSSTPDNNTPTPVPVCEHRDIYAHHVVDGGLVHLEYRCSCGQRVKGPKPL